MFLLSESIKKIGSKTTKKRWKQHFPHHKTGRIFRHSSANYSILSGTIWSKFELLLDIMHVLIPTDLKWIGLIESEKK